MPENNQLKKYILIIIAGALWGTIGMFVKLLNRAGASSSYTTMLRMTFGFLILFLITVIKEGLPAFKVTKGTLLSCLLLGIFSMSLNNLCYASAVNRLGMSLGVALLYMAPVFTCIESKILFKEDIGKTKILAIILNILGCTLAVTGGDFSGISLSLSGILFGLGAALAYSTQSVFGRMATDDAPPFVVATYNFFFAMLFTAIIAHPWTSVENPLDPKMLFLGFLFGLIPTAFAYLLYFKGIQGLTETSKVPVLCSMEVVFAAILGFCLFGEALGIASMSGIALVVISIAVMNR